MRTLYSVMAALAIVMAAPASANSWRHGMFQAQAQQRSHPDRFQRQPQREFRNPQQQPPDRGPRGGRMTEQERRDLNRDLDRANRELYKDRR